MTPTAPGPSGPADQPQPTAATPAAPPRHGTIAWALGFLAYLPLPMVGLLVAGITQLIVGLAQRKHGGLAALNGVRAANWGLTQLCLPVVVLLAVVIGIVTGEPSPQGGVYFTAAMNVVMVVMAILFFVVALLEAIYAIVGTIQASRGREIRLPVIPFLRTPR